MRQGDRRTGAISVAGVGIPVLLWVLGELKVHPPKIVLYALLILSVALIVGPWLLIWLHRRQPATEQRAPHESAPALPMDRQRAVKRGKDLLRKIKAEQITFSAAPWNTASGTFLRNRTAEVQRWATAPGSTKAVPTAPDGKPTEMDYAQLIAYVKEAIDAMEDQ